MYFNLKDFRRNFDIRQTEVAKLLGYDQSSISRIEANRLELSQGQYDILANAYGKDKTEPYIVTMQPSIDLPKKEETNKADNAYAELREVMKQMQDTNDKLLAMNERLMNIIENIIRPVSVS